MKTLFSILRIFVMVWAASQLPDGYMYVAWVVAVVWGLTEYLTGLADGEK